MIEFIVLLFIVVAFSFLVYPIVDVSTFLLNISIFVILSIKVKADLKNDMHAYYLGSAGITAFIFILTGTGFLREQLAFLLSLRVLNFTIVAILVLLIAHLLGVLHMMQQRVLKNV